MEWQIGREEGKPGLDHSDRLFVPLKGHGRAVDPIEKRVVLRIPAEEVTIHLRCPLMFTCLLQTLCKTKLCLHVRRLRTCAGRYEQHQYEAEPCKCLYAYKEMYLPPA